MSSWSLSYHDTCLLKSFFKYQKKKKKKKKRKRKKKNKYDIFILTRDLFNTCFSFTGVLKIELKTFSSTIVVVVLPYENNVRSVFDSNSLRSE